jgi:hypothetical protein
MSNVHNLGPADAPRQILGRDPAAILAAVQVVLALLLSFGVLDVIGLKGQDDLAVVVTVLGALVALYLAWGTTETALAALVELVKAAVALGAIYGLQITTEQTGLLIATVTAISTAWLRTQTSPLARGSFATIQPDDVVTPQAA